MARGYSQSRSETPADLVKIGENSYIKKSQVPEYEAHGDSMFGDNTLGVSGVKTDEELDAAGVKHPLVREFLKDPVAMQRIAKAFSAVEAPEEAGEYTSSESDYAWNGERDVYTGSTPTDWRGGEWEMGADGSPPSVVVKYKDEYFEVGANGLIDLDGEESPIVDLRGYDVGLSFGSSDKGVVDNLKRYGNFADDDLERSGSFINLDKPAPEPKKK